MVLSHQTISDKQLNHYRRKKTFKTQVYYFSKTVESKTLHSNFLVCFVNKNIKKEKNTQGSMNKPYVEEIGYTSFLHCLQCIAMVMWPIVMAA
jgi:hypothetical protein